MAENTKIEWADHSASPWHGCVEVHAGCDNCYARTMAKRNPGTLGVWGKDGTRVMSASFAKNCRRWNKEIQAGRVAWELHVELCKQSGIADPAKEWAVRSNGEPIPSSFATVFPSICDPFEDWQGPILDSKVKRLACCHRVCGYQAIDELPADGARWVTMDDLRRDFFDLIDECQSLRFLLLTKRPENVRRKWPDGRYRPNVALITSVSDQATADAMIPPLLACVPRPCVDVGRVARADVGAGGFNAHRGSDFPGRQIQFAACSRKGGVGNWRFYRLGDRWRRERPRRTPVPSGMDSLDPRPVQGSGCGVFHQAVGEPP